MQLLTAWVVGHTDRFRAASSNCPVINWLSFVGQVDGNYLRWYADFEKFPWEDPAEHIRRSPLMYVGNVTTPTMLMTGVKDLTPTTWWPVDTWTRTTSAPSFVYGCSGGGVLTAWVVGHTDRFRAASSNCPVINWLSFVGQVDGNYLRWYADFEKFPWEDPAEHIRRSP